MSNDSAARSRCSTALPIQSHAARVAQLLDQYGCGPIQFVGKKNAFYERHLVFDRVIDPEVRDE